MAGIVADFIRASLARGLEPFTFASRPPLDYWRLMATEMRQSGSAEADFLDAAIRCAETGEPQRLPHGTVTRADLQSGNVYMITDAPLERISFTIDVGPESAA